MGVPYDEILENAFTHESIHAYCFISLEENPAFRSEVATLMEYMNLAIQRDFKDDKVVNMVWMNIYGDPISIAQHKRPSYDEIIAYSFTMAKIKKTFQQIKIKEYGNISAWDKLVNLISIHDQYGHLLLYAQKYSDIPERDFIRATMKYKLYLKNKETKSLDKDYKADGGLVKGSSHAEGGVDLTVQSTGHKENGCP
jgi:hypothetical protein